MSKMIRKIITQKNDHESVDINDNDHISNIFEKSNKNINNENNKEESSNLFLVNLNIFEN